VPNESVAHAQKMRDQLYQQIVHVATQGQKQNCKTGVPEYRVVDPNGDKAQPLTVAPNGHGAGQNSFHVRKEIGRCASRDEYESRPPISRSAFTTWTP
jgi:hypothetical protein